MKEELLYKWGRFKWIECLSALHQLHQRTSLTCFPESIFLRQLQWKLFHLMKIRQKDTLQRMWWFGCLCGEFAKFGNAWKIFGQFSDEIKKKMKSKGLGLYQIPCNHNDEKYHHLLWRSLADMQIAVMHNAYFRMGDMSSISTPKCTSLLHIDFNYHIA